MPITGIRAVDRNLTILGVLWTGGVMSAIDITAAGKLGIDTGPVCKMLRWWIKLNMVEEVKAKYRITDKGQKFISRFF